jgi:D-psicose/D-tagatose/L-ribulose 3-epimerase
VVADLAAERGIRLGIEPPNRYETSVVNTVEQGAELIDGLPADVVGLTLDTYHMNIEERSLDAAFAAAGDRLVHVQVCGNDGGVRDTTRCVGTMSIWRPLAPTQDALAIDGLRFLEACRAR